MRTNVALSNKALAFSGNKCPRGHHDWRIISVDIIECGPCLDERKAAKLAADHHAEALKRHHDRLADPYGKLTNEQRAARNLPCQSGHEGCWRPRANSTPKCTACAYLDGVSRAKRVQYFNLTGEHLPTLRAVVEEERRGLPPKPKTKVEPPRNPTSAYWFGNEIRTKNTVTAARTQAVLEGFEKGQYEFGTYEPPKRWIS